MQLFKNLLSLFSFVLRYTRNVKYAHAMGIGVVVAGTVSGLANTVLIGVVNHVISASQPRSGSLLWIFVGVCVLLPVSRYVGEFLLTYLSEKATLDLRMTLSRKILAAPLRQLEETGVSALQVALTGDIGTVIGAVTLLPVLSMNIAIVIGSLVYMGTLSGKILLMVILFMVVGMVAYQLPVTKAQDHIKAMREKSDVLFGHFRAITEGTKELKLHQDRRRNFLENDLKGTSLELSGLGVATQRLFASAATWGQVLVFILVGLIAFLLPTILQVERTVLTGYTLAILYMVSPIQVIMNSLPQLSRATTSMRRLEQMNLSLEDAPPTPELPARARDAGWSLLEMDGVTHTYHVEREQANFTLGPIDLKFQPGEIVFVTGGNGSGKTTFAKLLTGLYTPETGELRLDGVPVTDANRAEYFSLFSAVFSDYFLFPLLMSPDRQELDTQAQRYLAELHLDHKVRVENGQLSTTLLSQGQRKRLALLSVYLEDRPICLFDEWAADQDPQFKEVFYYELLPQLRERGKTVFAVTHDDRFYHVADRVIKLDYGRVVATPPRLEEAVAPAGLP